MHTDMRAYKVLPLILFMMAIGLSAVAQKMSVASFRIDEADQTANVSPTMRYDVNGEKCALIKIATTQKNFSFDVGTLGIEYVENQNAAHPGEIWLYVPHGVIKISIQHPQFGSIKDYDLGRRLEKGRTYVMELTSDQVNTLIVDYDNTQALEIDVTPPGATLYINGIRQILDSRGHASLQLSFGTHTYRVTADDYHPEESQVVINDKDSHPRLSVRLRQAFGYLDVLSTPQSEGGDLYVDDIHVGTLPVSKLHLKSGSHKIAVHRKLYLPYTGNVVITDSAVVAITPSLKPNYADCEIIAGNGDQSVTIYDNGDLLGNGRWKGRLEAGQHVIEAVKPGHRTTTETVSIVRGDTRKVSLQPPTPIYGALEIVTTPPGAEVYIDGSPHPAGKTTYYDGRILIGSHNIRVAKKGYKTEEFKVTIREGEAERLNCRLTDFCSATINSAPNGYISIDGVYQGRTPLQLNRTAGSYKVTITADGYCSYNRRLYFDGNTKDFNVRLRRNLVRANEFYIFGGVDILNFPTVGIGLGGYIHNFNIEGSYVTSLSKSQTIYWIDSESDFPPISSAYKPEGGCLRIGYGVGLGGRVRITPQIGAQFINLKEISSNDFTGGSKATSFTAGLRINFSIVNGFGIAITPDYFMPITRTEGFKALASVSSKIKNYAEGLKINFSIYIFF